MIEHPVAFWSGLVVTVAALGGIGWALVLEWRRSRRNGW